MIHQNWTSAWVLKIEALLIFPKVQGMDWVSLVLQHTGNDPTTGFSWLKLARWTIDSVQLDHPEDVHKSLCWWQAELLHCNDTKLRSLWPPMRTVLTQMQPIWSDRTKISLKIWGPLLVIHLVKWEILRYTTKCQCFCFSLSLRLTWSVKIKDAPVSAPFRPLQSWNCRVNKDPASKADKKYFKIWFLWVKYGEVHVQVTF